MANILNAVSGKELATRWVNKVNDRTPYLLEALFPSRKQMGIELSMLTGKTPAIRPLDPSSFDAKVIPISRANFSKVTTEMPFFKNSLNVNEKDRQQLLMVLSTGNAGYIDTVMNKVYNDGERLLENARVVPEIMRSQILTTGQIAFEGNGQAYSYDYEVANKGNATVAWTSANADPISDITAWQDAIENSTGVRPTGILMNRNTFNMLAKVDAIKNAIYVLGEGRVTPSGDEVRKYILGATDCNIYVYAKGYTDPKTEQFTKFVGDGVVVLFPEGENLGETVYGTTPEEADLLGGATDADVQIVDTGVAITEYVQADPVMRSVKVSEVVLPTLEKADYIFIGDVD